MYTLILVDDEPLALKQLSSLIKWEDYGFKLLKTFTRGQEAITFIEKNHPDLVITDIKMPYVTGIDIAEYCFNSHFLTTVAFMSAYRDFEYAQCALSYGVSEYIEKPIKKKDIIALLKKSVTSSFFAAVNNENSKLQWIFSDLLYGIVSDEQELKDRFSNICIPPETVYCPCAIFNLHINDFDMYLKNVWHYQTDKLYSSMSYIISDENDYCHFNIIRHSYNNIEVIARFQFIDKEQLTLYIDKTSRELSEILKLSCTVTNISYYDRIADLINKPLKEIETFECDNTIINNVYEFIKNNYQKAISSKDAANHVMLSNSYFCNFYKKCTGEKFLTTLNKYRIQKAAELLLTDKSIKPSAMYKMVGFFNQGYFYETFKQYIGVTPAEFQKNPVIDKGEYPCILTKL